MFFLLLPLHPRLASQPTGSGNLVWWDIEGDCWNPINSDWAGPAQHVRDWLSFMEWKAQAPDSLLFSNPECGA